MSEEFSKETIKEAIEAEIDAVCISYFNLPLDINKLKGNPAVQVIGFIKDGTEDEWYDYSNVLRVLNYKLTEEQKSLIQAIYDWIINYSDKFQFMQLDADEKIIANYIRGRFPGRDGLGFFPNKIQKQVSDKLSGTTRNS